MTGTFPAVPGVPAAGHIYRGYWHPGRADGCPKCPDPDRPARGRGRHQHASRPVTAAQAAELAALRDGRVLPPPTSSSTVMIGRINAITAGAPAIQYELDKLTEWLNRLPRRA